MRGKLSEFDLYGILLLAAAGMKTGGLMLRRGDETVEVFLKDGDIVHATSPIGEGEKAIYYPIVWEEGFFALQANRSASARTIQRSSEQILEAVRAMRRELESAREVIPSPQSVFQLSDSAEEDAGPITIPHGAWRVLCRVDGRHTVEEIAAALKEPYAETAKLLSDLCKAGLVAIVSRLSGGKHRLHGAINCAGGAPDRRHGPDGSLCRARSNSRPRRISR